MEWVRRLMQVRCEERFQRRCQLNLDRSLSDQLALDLKPDPLRTQVDVKRQDLHSTDWLSERFGRDDDFGDPAYAGGPVEGVLVEVESVRIGEGQGWVGD